MGLAGIHVLVVDDEPDARELLSEMMAMVGAKVETAANVDDSWIGTDVDALFTERTDQLVAQFDGYEAVPGVHVKGKLTLGENIAAAFELHLQERGGRMGGRAVQLLRLDDESNPANAVQNVNRLVGRDRAEALAR